MAIVFELKNGDEYLTSHTGLCLVGALLERTELKDRLDKIVLSASCNPRINHSDIVYSQIWLLCLAESDFEDIEPFRGNPFFVQALKMQQCPSSSALRQRLDEVEKAFDGIIKEESGALLGHISPVLMPINTGGGMLVPLDLDVSPFDNAKTKKKGVSRTYKGFDGYAPIFCYLGHEGYLVNLELREGKQHCQHNTPAFLQESIRYAKQITDQKLLVRMDSGDDSLENINVCLEQGVQWVIERNLRREDKRRWLQLPRETGTRTSPRTGKNIWCGVTERYVAKLDKTLRIVFEATERTITAKGQMLALPGIEVDTYWVSLELCAYETILLYHDHGESEQFHSELKSDMELERLPNGRFATNALVLLCGMLAYNILRICGQESVRQDNGNLDKRPTYRRKPKRRIACKVMQDLMYMAGRVVFHGRQWFISYGRSSTWAEEWDNLYERFMEPLAGAG